MKQFGVTCDLNDQQIHIPPKTYTPTKLVVESDWSGASYWFAFAALAAHAEIELPNMTLRSLQGDRVVVDIMEMLGVKSEPRGGSLLLVHKEHHPEIVWDFTHCPDLAQTVAVVCAAKGIKGNFTGLESLRIKETDRINALQIELGKFGASLEERNGTWVLTPTTTLPASISVNTYLDHRMAMAFAPLATCMDVTIENPDVVKKSYPKFWDDVRSLGIAAALS
jgi:3-phosphoshikimate 1-carboxyvinyltransferase